MYLFIHKLNHLLLLLFFILPELMLGINLKYKYIICRGNVL